MAGPRPGGQFSVQVAGAGSVVVSGKTAKLSLGWVLVACALLAGAGCDEPPTTTQPSSNPALTVEPFSGTLVKGGTTFYSFVVPVKGTVSLTLLTLTIAGAPTDLAIQMGMGVPAGTTCSTTVLPSVTAGAAPQLSNNDVNPGIYCVILTDANNNTLTANANFNVNITRPR